MPQEISCYHGFTVRENLEFFGKMYGVKGKELKEKISYLLKWLSLGKFENREVENLSGGYKRLLNIACSLIHDPMIIFMDEPTVGLDPEIRHLMWEKIKELKENGKTICLTTHYLDEAQTLCDRIGILVNGRLLVKGVPEDLIMRYGGYRILIIKLSEAVSVDDAESVKNSFPGSQTEVLGNTIVISFMQEHSLAP